MSRNYGMYAKNIENTVNSKPFTSTRLYHCNAYIIKSHDDIFLKSYSTIVGHLTDNNRCVAYGTYSATTVQHIYKFARLFGCDELVFVNNDTAEVERIVAL